MSKTLTQEQRYVISALLKRNVSKIEITKEVGCYKSTIYNEISRNSCRNGHYSPTKAYEMAMERRDRIVTNSALKPGVLSKALTLLIEEQWSPWHISGYLVLKGIKISREHIYQEIRADKSGELASHTRRHMKHRKCYGYAKADVRNIPNRINIHDRPSEADGKRFGDWEMDLIVDRQQNAIVTFTERSTNFISMERLPEGKKAAPLAKVVVRMLFPWRDGVRTITTDNGDEFAAHADITKGLKRKLLPDVLVYFADPYASWQKGAIENANGIIRQYIPKDMKFNDLTDAQIRELQYNLNRRPREKLNFSAPIAEFNLFFRNSHPPVVFALEI